VSPSFRFLDGFTYILGTNRETKQQEGIALMNMKTVSMDRRKRIALVAHDHKKQDLLDGRGSTS
jgi:hypothetical protein